MPISQFYGVLNDSQGKTPADVHGGYLLEEGNWTSEDWTSFYVTCIHCIQEYVDKGLVAFNDQVLYDRQLLAAASHDETLLQIMQGFIEEVVRSSGVCERDQVMNLYQTNPDLERYSDWSASWKTRRFKDIAAGMGYQVNPGRTGNRWQQKVNGEMKDFYELVRPLQPEAPKDQNGSPAIQTNAEKAAAEEAPVVKGGRFAGFLFGK